MPSLLAISDLHVGYRQNREIVEGLLPQDDGDWLIVAGDVGERLADIAATLELLAGRFAKVIWTPGNHELWTHPRDPVTARGVERYRKLLDVCRLLGVLTPEDPFPRWAGVDGEVVIAPLFLLYDYSFRLPGLHTKEQSLQAAYDAGVVCKDEQFLHPAPFESIEEWCRVRVEYSRRRLDDCDPSLPTVLVNHWPLVRSPTETLRFPVFAQWCGTELTADWHLRYRAQAVVYGHLHIPRVIHEDGVPMVEVSLGYPREWTRRERKPALLRTIL